MAQPDQTRRRWSWWYLLFLVPFVAVLWPPWFDDCALRLGWAVGMIAGTWMAASVGFVPTYPLAIGGFVLPGFTALYTVILNLVVAVVLTPMLRAMRGGGVPADETVAADYCG